MKIQDLKLSIVFLLVALLMGCDKYPSIEDDMLDGNIVFDPSINNPEQFLISAKYPNPTLGDLNRHIIIAAHGYTSTTFEWSEFQEWSQNSN